MNKIIANITIDDSNMEISRKAINELNDVIKQKVLWAVDEYITEHMNLKGNKYNHITDVVGYVCEFGFDYYDWEESLTLSKAKCKELFNEAVERSKKDYLYGKDMVFYSTNDDGDIDRDAKRLTVNVDVKTEREFEVIKKRNITIDDLPYCIGDNDK